MKFVYRGQWGARPPKCVNQLPPIDGIAYHYTASNADEQASHRNCAARVRAVQAYHMDTQGWCDIAYNWLVCKHGYVYQGRGQHRSGATGNANDHTVAICFLGDDTAGRDDLTNEGRQALVDATRHVHRVLRKPSLTYKGHRDYMSTSCPGDQIHAFVTGAAFKRRVRAA